MGCGVSSVECLDWGVGIGQCSAECGVLESGVWS